MAAKSLPECIIPVVSCDKLDHESWTDHGTAGRSLANFPHPFRMLLVGVPGTGKSATIKNILPRIHPPFERIICRHNNPMYKELKDCGAIVIPRLPKPCDLEDAVQEVLNPPPEEADAEGEQAEEEGASVPPEPRTVKGLASEPDAEVEVKQKPIEPPRKRKTVVIIDDFNLSGWSKEEKGHLAELLQYGSTHLGISVIIATQRMFNVPVPLRVCSNVFVIFNTSNRPDLDAMASRVNLDVPVLRKLIKKNCIDVHDSLCIDLTSGSPMPLRRNLFEEVRI